MYSSQWGRSELSEWLLRSILSGSVLKHLQPFIRAIDSDAVRHMPVVECDLPSGSVLERRFIETAYFRDSYRAPLSRMHASVIDIFLGIFAHHPMWMKILLIVRNRI